MYINKPYWIFRVASIPEVGSGHMMRSLSLARALSLHVEIHFILERGGEHWIPRLRDKGFTVQIEKSDDFSLLNYRDISNCLGILVDDYSVSKNSMLKWKKQFVQLALIDDYGTAPYYVDFVISPGLNDIKKKYNNQLLMCGSNYALLAPEYSLDNQQKYALTVRTILLCFGSFDSKNCTEIALNALNKTGFRGIAQIAIGSNAPHLEKIKKMISRYDFKTEIYENVDGLYELTLNSDLVIGAGGVSLLERMALGKASVTFIVADNQKQQVEWAKSIGATIALNLNKCLLESDIINAFNLLLTDNSKRKNMSKVAKNSVDGKGAQRVSKALLSNMKMVGGLYV